MRHSVRVALVSVALSILTITLGAAPAVRLRGESVEAEVLVKLKSSASANEVAALERLADADEVENISSLRGGALMRVHSRSKNVDALVKALEQNPNIEYVEPNYLLEISASPNDPRYAELWGLRNTGQVISGSTGLAGADISAENAWNVTTGSQQIVVGVVDTGVDYNHPDLAANMWTNPGGFGNAQCAAGTFGFNAINRSCDPRDDHYHGTHVAGTIGAVGNNGIGITGVNWNVRIMALKFLGSSGSGTTADAIVAIEFAVQAKIAGANVRVLNNSWGGGSFSRALLDEINKANEHDILFVAAAGNDSSNNDTFPKYPASYATPNMVAVAATDNRDGMAFFSNYGPTTVHLGAPGVNVLSAVPGSSYSYLSGTSMASPHVAGVAALVLATNQNLTTAQLKTTLLNSTDPISSMSGRVITGGRLNAAKAVGAPAGPEFTLSVSPQSRTVTRGSVTTYTVTVTPANGFNSSVALSATNLPSGVTAAFNPASTTTTSTLTLTTTTNTPTGTFNFTIAGTGGGVSRSTTASITVNAPATAAACPSFPNRVHYSSTAPTAIAVGDINRDAISDLVVANVSSNRVSVHLGNASGTFLSSVSYAAGTAPVSVAIGDLNGDSRPDVAVANSNENSVSVLMGTGDGALGSAVEYTAGTNPFGVAIGDFNGDGKLDLAVANNGSGNVSILLNNGDGTFAAAVNYAVTSGPFAVAAGDLNQDGTLDLAVATFNAGRVSVLQGIPGGTFGAPSNYPAGSGTSSVAIADVNRDGRPDLVASNFISNNVSVLIGQPGSSFAAAVQYAVGTAPYAVAVADFNNDARPDLITANSGSANATLLINNGSAFQPGVTFIAGTTPNHVATGDFNGDGKTDFAVANTDYPSVSVHLNTGACSTNCSHMVTAGDYPTGTAPVAIAAGDLDRDGDLDLVTANSASHNISVRLNNGDRSLGASVQYGAGNGPEGVALGDLDRDGKLDVVTAASALDTVVVRRGNGDGTFAAGSESFGTGDAPNGVAIGDFNRDGRLDLAAANGGGNSVSILLGNGDATFQTATSYGAGTSPRGVAAGDFNRDGRLDLAVVNFGSNDVSILIGASNGTFQAATSVSVGQAPRGVVVADLNRDGKLDFATTNSGSNDITVRLGNGDGSFAGGVTYSAGVSPRGIIAADFSDDGRLDLAVANEGSNNVSVLIGNDGIFASPLNTPVGSGAAGLAAADFDRDAKPDIAAVNLNASTLSVLVNTCPLPDLIVTKTHTGTFAQGDLGRTYTITVTNAGVIATTDAVTVTDVLPNGLAAVSMSGTGWTCAGTTCTRGDALAGGASYPPITLTVNVGGSAPATVTNVVNVSGGGELNTINSTASDPTTISQSRDLMVTVTHSGNFAQGNTGRTYSITGRNAGGLATSGDTTITASVPVGLTATAMSGSGWNCVVATLSCTRGDSLAGGGSFPEITLTVNVAANAPPLVTMSATISNASDANFSNNTANDPTVVWSSQSCASFSAPTAVTTGWYPNSIAARDYNGDGRIDLAVANSDEGRVSIHLGDGNGTFAAGVYYTTGAWAYSVTAVDLNLDAKLDLAVANLSGNTISILIGNGNGTFQPAVNYAINSPANIAAGDFNKDGNPDLAATMLYSSAVGVLLGNGNGTLQASVTVSIGTSVDGIAAADFNSDGSLDLLMSRENGGIAIVLGNGNATFGSPTLYSSSSYSYAIAVADFNRDGKLDAVVPNYYSGTVTVFLGTGTGTFTTGGNYNAVSQIEDVVSEDINGDGYADVIGSGFGSSNVAVLLGNADGSLQSPATFTTGSGSDDVVVGDFNADGRADLAVTAFYSRQVAVLLGGCPELTITKTHTGNFSAGQSSAVYTITVQNTGTSSSRGTVTVTDTLPSGLTAVSMTGSSWSCNTTTVSCTRTAPIANGSSSTITLTVSVAGNAPSSVTNTASVSGGGDVNPNNNTATDPTNIIKAPDLTISKTHSGGSFLQGETGRVYTIVVSNVGEGPTTGTVQVTDSMPSGIFATAISGTGWTCSTGSMSCSRSDALAANGAYPPITITVNVSASAPASVTNVANVSGGGDVSTSNNSASAITVVLATPRNFIATGISPSQVTLSWSAVSGATNYQVLRRNADGSYSVIATPVANTYLDSNLAANTSYVYQVRAVDASAQGPLSTRDVATTIVFTDDPIIARVTSPKPVHFTELRTAVNAVRAAAGLAPANFVDDVLSTGMLVRAGHITDLRARLNEARTILGLPTLVYTDPSLGIGTVVKAAHIGDLRAGVK